MVKISQVAMNILSHLFDRLDSQQEGAILEAFPVLAGWLSGSCNGGFRAQEAAIYAISSLCKISPSCYARITTHKGIWC